MDKLRELHLPHSIFWDCYNDEPEEEDHALKSAEITADVAIKFAQWIDKSSFTYYKEENIWRSIATEEKKTNEELFEDFINSYYER